MGRCLSGYYKRYWKHVINGPLAWLEGDGQQAWVAGWCSVERPVYEGPNVYHQLPTDLPFVFRPKQGELKSHSLLMSAGFQMHHDQYSPMSYYLLNDYLVSVLQTADATDYMIRMHSLLTRKVIWERLLGRDLLGQSYYASYPFRAGSWVLVDTVQGVACLDVASGAEQWDFAHSSRLRWVVPVDTDDVIFGLANGLIVRMTAGGEVAWHYQATSLTDLEGLDVSSNALIIRESGISESTEAVALRGFYGGKYTALSLDSGNELPLVETWLQHDKFAVAGEFVWQMWRYTYRPGPYNGDKAIYRLRGYSAPIRDLNLLQEGMLVRPGYLLVAEQDGVRTRLVMLLESR